MKQPAPLFFFLTLLFFLFIPGVSEAEEVDAAADLALDLVGENDQGYITSELVQYVYKESKVDLSPRSAADQWVEGEEVESLQAGDVVFFQGTHLMSGIYINDGRFVIVTSEGISERNLETSEYWSNAYQGAKRHSEDSSPPSSDNEIVEKAKSLIGTPYKRNGSSPDEGFNSGGFVYYVFKEVTGSWLSKRPSSLLEAGMDVEKDNLKIGDLVFFENDEQEQISGIYSGDNQFIIATSSGVQERNLRYHSYYADRYIGASRFTKEILEKSNPDMYSDHGHPAVKEAMNYLGTPYLLTGSTLEAFDCSFLVQMVFRDSMDIYLPRITYKQWKVGEDLNIDEYELGNDQLTPGDVLFFSGTWQEGISHSAIYLGNDYIVHATGEEGQTTISYMSKYWRDHYTGAKSFDDIAIQYESEAVYEALQLVGTKYTQGGESSEEGFDTGGFVQYVYNEAWQYELPRYGRQQWEEGTKVSRDDAEPGDIFFFQGASIIPAIYVGNNQMIVATNSYGVALIDLTTSDYWPSRYIGARTYDTESE